MNEDKLGHLTYKELQEQNKDFSYDDYRRYVANHHINEKLTQPIGWEEGTHIQSPIFQATEGEDYLGNSRYDQDIYREQTLDNAFDTRAENQSWLAKVGAGLAKGALTFGTTYLQGNMGLAMALFQGIDNVLDNKDNTKFLYGFVDNPYLEWAYGISKWGEEVFPNYYSSEEIKNDEEGKWWKNMASGNFIGDKILKNAGFTIGALYSSAGISAGLNAIAKVAGIAGKSATKAVIGGVTTTLMAASEASLDASNNMKDDYLVKGKQTVEERAAIDKQAIYDKYAPIFNQIDAEYEANKANLVQYDKESGKFINPNYDKYLQQRSFVEAQMQAELAGVDDASNAALQRLADTRLKVATEDFLNQFPTLLLSEGLQWGRMFANGFKTANRASHIVSNGKLFGIAGTEKAANWLSQETKAMQRMRGIGKGIGRGFMEAHEEIGQKIDYELPKAYYMQDVMNFYAASMDPDAELETMSRMNAVRDGLRTTLQDPSTWEEGFLGFLPGAFGVPVFGKRFTSSNETWLGRNRAVGITGGIGGAIKENNARLAQEKIVIDAVNKRVQEPDFVNYWQGLIRHEKYQKEMDLAVEENDKAKFEDANQAQMISDIVMFDNAGKLNDLIDFVSAITDESKENIASIVEQTTQSLKDNTKFQEDMQNLVNRTAATMNEVNTMSNEVDRLNRELEENNPIFEHTYDPVTGESVQTSRHLTNEEIKAKKSRIASLEQTIEEKREEVNSLMEEMQNKDLEQRKSIGAFVDEYGNIDDEEYIAQKIKENRDDLIKTIKLYRDNKREIDSNSDNKLSNEQLATLTWLKTHTQKWEERAKSMESALKENFLPKAISFYQDLLSKDNITDKEKEDATHKLELLQSLQSSKDLANELLGNKTNLLESLIIAQNPAITGTDLQDVTSMLTDLPRIKMLSTEYVNKFNEYINNAEKLEQDMAKSRENTASIRNKRESKILKKKVADIASKFNWDSSDDITQSFEAAKEEIDALGGEKVFTDNLTKEQKVLFKQARKSNKFDVSAVSGIEGSDLSNESKRKLVEAYDEMDKSMDVNDKLNTLMENIDSILEKSNPDLIEDTPEQREFMVEEQTKAMKVLQEISDTMKDYKKSLEYASTIEEKIDKVAEDAEERPLNQPTDETPSEEPDVQEPDDLDYDFTDQRISRRQAKGYNGKSTQEFGHVQEPGSEPLLRPQISEYYLHTINKKLYSEYLDEFPAARPEMLDGYTYKQYREYIGALEEYLHEHGAFEYVKHHLKKGDKIEFVVEKIGGQEVVLMVTDNNQVIGSLPAEIDFHYYSKYPLEYDEQGNPTRWTQTEDTLRTRDKARYAQYKSIIEAYHRGNPTLIYKPNSKPIITEEGAKLATKLSEEKKDLLKEYEDKLNAEPEASDERIEEILEELHEKLQLPEGLYVVSDYDKQSGKFSLKGIEVRDTFANTVPFYAVNSPFLKYSIGDAVNYYEEGTAFFGVVTKVDKDGHILEVIDKDDGRIIVKDGKSLSRNEIVTQPKKSFNGKDNQSSITQTVTETINQDKVKAIKAEFVDNNKSLGDAAYDQDGGHQLFDALWDAYNCIDNPNASEELRNSRFNNLIEIAKKYPNNDLAKRIINEVQTQTITSQQSTSSNSSPIVYGTSRVAELMGGMLSLNGASKNDSAESARAKTELTISDVFGNETPVIGIIGKDNKMFLSKPSVKNSVILPRGEQGQIYVMVPTNKGTYIPALVYSRLVSEVMDTAYTDAVVKKIQEVAAADRTTSPKLRGELEKMLRVPTGQFKIQYYDKGAKAGQAGKVRQNPKGAAYIGIAVDKGNKGMFWIPVEDGKVSEEDAMKFIKELVHKYPDTSTGWDINQLTNPNYAAFMADYLVSNLNDPHSINDFFTYELNSEESRKEQVDKESKKEAAVQEETEKKGHNVVIEVNDGEELSVNNEGIVKDKDGQVVSGVRLTTFKTGLDLDSSSKPTEGQEGEQKIGLKGLFQRPKNLEVTKETSSERMTTEKQLYEDVERLKKLFPSLSTPDRIVIRDSLIDSVDRNGNPVKAYGAFINGVLYISRQSPRGTSYHESFHHLIDTLLNGRDKNLLIHEAKSRYKTNDDLEAEDKLAEAFRKFMNNITEKGISGFLHRTFVKLKHFVNTIARNRDAIDILFWDIYMNRPHNIVSTNVNNFNISAIDTSRVDIIESQNPNEHEGNKTLKIYIKDHPEKGYFELVKDREFGQYSVHFKTGNADTREVYGSTKQERNILFEELRKAIPEGAVVSTWGNVSQGGVKAIIKVGSGMTRIGERKVKDRKGNSIYIPIYRKGPELSAMEQVDVSAYHAQLINYANRKYGYDRLDRETKDYLEQRGVTKEHYEGMTYEQKEYLLHCM